MSLCRVMVKSDYEGPKFSSALQFRLCFGEFITDLEKLDDCNFSEQGVSGSSPSIQLGVFTLDPILL